MCGSYAKSGRNCIRTTFDDWLPSWKEFREWFLDYPAVKAADGEDPELKARI
jgi:hypothetical protein